MERRDSRNIILSVLAIAILLIAVIGITYALYKFTKGGTEVNTINTGTISMQYDESDTNVISIKDALPTLDEVGKKQQEYFDFTLSSSIRGKAKLNYEIRAEVIDVDTNKQLDPSYVKMYLEKQEDGVYKEVLAPKIFEINNDSIITGDNVNKDTMLLYTGAFNNNMDINSYSDNFRLRMWFRGDRDVLTESKTFKVRINVYASME